MKAEVRICFYASTKLQGWRKFVIGLMCWSKHTHAHLELQCQKNRIVFLTMDGLQPRVVRLGLNKKFLGDTAYAEFSLGDIDYEEEDLIWAENYPSTHHWDLIWYQFLRYWGLEDKDNPPPTCTTFLSDFLSRHGISVPRFFSPKQLWRYLYDDCNDWR